MKLMFSQFGKKYYYQTSYRCFTPIWTKTLNQESLSLFSFYVEMKPFDLFFKNAATTILLFLHSERENNIGHMDIPQSNCGPLWTITSKNHWEQKTLALQVIWWNTLELLGSVIKFYTQGGSFLWSFLNGVQRYSNIPSIQLQIGGSWWVSFFRKCIVLQFKESNVLFQEIALNEFIQ